MEEIILLDKGKRIGMFWEVGLRGDGRRGCGRWFKEG